MSVSEVGVVGEQGVLSRVSFKVSEDKENTYLSFSAQTRCPAAPLLLCGTPALALCSLNMVDVQLCFSASQADHKHPLRGFSVSWPACTPGPRGTCLLRLVGGDQLYTQVLVILWVRVGALSPGALRDSMFKEENHSGTC